MSALLPLLLLAPAALAQSEAPPTVEYRERTEIHENEFRGLEVEGALIGPGDILISEVERKPFPSWIRVRTDFDDQLHASTDQVR